MRRTRAVCAAGVMSVAAVLVMGCAPTPDPGGPPPACPARQKIVVPGTSSSMVRGLSTNGQWVVTANTDGPDLTLTIRSVDGAAPATVVTTLVGYNDNAAPAGERLSVGVSEDGDQVAFQGQRWERSTGVVSPVSPPAPGATVRNSSPDRTHLAWSVPGETAPTVTDAFTDEVLGWTGLADNFGWESPSGRFGYAVGDLLVDFADGSSVSIAPAIDAVNASGQFNLVNPVAASNNGRFLLIESSWSTGGHPPSVRKLWSWDVTTATLGEISGSFGMAQVADDGTVAWVNSAAIADGILVTSPDGTVRAAHSGSGLFAMVRGFFATSDLRSIVFSAYTGPLSSEYTAYASRCQ